MAIVSVTKDNITEMVAARAGEQQKEPEPVKVEEPKEAKAEPEGDKVKKPIQERISELTRDKRELEEAWQSEYEARILAQNRLKELETQKPKAEEPKDERPDRTKYKPEEVEKYENDLLSWNRREAIREFQAEQARVQAEAAQKAAQERLEALTKEARAEIEDFDEVIANADRRKEVIPNHVVAAITESDKGPHLAYYLAKNPDEAKRIFALTPAKALLALGKIELNFTKTELKETPKPVEKPPVTKAPAPMASITGGGGELPKDLSKPMSFREYAAARKEEIRAKRR
jgi:hypothetical protein